MAVEAVVAVPQLATARVVAAVQMVVMVMQVAVALALALAVAVPWRACPQPLVVVRRQPGAASAPCGLPGGRLCVDRPRCWVLSPLA